MLKKSERLTRQEFDRSFKLGKRLHSPLLQLIYHPSDTFHGSVVVSKKVAKRAVDRNKLRRRIYGVLYTDLKGKEVHATVIVIAKQGLLSLSRKETALQVRELLSRMLEARS
jgi:ribonuclease P protein component